MNEYKAKDYTFPAIEGISEKALAIHTGLYQGYVTNLNAHYKKLAEECKGGDGNTLVVSALTRRIGFELAGIKNHELYFDALEGGAAECSTDSTFHSFVEKSFGSLAMFQDCIKKTALSMRGIGWALALYDKDMQAPHFVWVSDHELGNVNLPALLAVDMWEHSYMPDYAPADKGAYVDAYLNAVNWKFVEERFATL